MKVIVNKVLITDDDKEFKIGWEIAFTKDNKHHIVKIVDIFEDISGDSGHILASDVEIDRRNIEGIHMFYFKDMEDCSYVSVG